MCLHFVNFVSISPPQANAARFPKLEFVGFSNSPQQIGYIRAQAEKRGLTNLNVHVEDYADFVQRDSSKLGPDVPAFDAAIAIETIEHAQVRSKRWVGGGGCVVVGGGG